MEDLRRSWDSFNEPTSCHSPLVVRAGAICVFVMCSAQSWVLFEFYTSSKRYEHIFAIVDEDWHIAGGQELFGTQGVKLIILLSGFITLLGVVVACIGCIGSQVRGVTTPICVYFCCTAALAVVFFSMFMQAVLFSAFLEPVVERQGEEFCNATLHWTYSAALHCNASAKAAQMPAGWALDECGPECADRLTLIRRMGGCDLLGDLCHRYDYSGMGAGFCLIEAGNGSNVLPPVPLIRSKVGRRVSEQCCRLACDTRVSCRGYSYQPANGTCWVLSPRKPKSWVLDKGDGKNTSDDGCGGIRWTPNTTDWPDKVPMEIVAADGNFGTFCMRKSRPTLVGDAEGAARGASAVCLATALVLTCASACGCSFQYTLVTHRKGRKGAGGLVTKMLCAGCFKRSERPRKFGHLLHTESSSEEESDKDELDSDT